MMRAPKPYNPPPSDRLVTVYVDDALIVADKPSGLLSVPGLGPEKAVCANSMLSARHGPVLTVHRLDMDTSGLIIFARTKDTQRALSRQFEARQVEKQYEALVDGLLRDEGGVIDKAIARHSLNRPLRHLDPDGQTAITEWRVLARTETSTRVALTPKTGRSHQLRLHMASLGHPILGDVFYGDPASHARLCLHAARLTFSHPNSDQILNLETKTPF
ncbi:MAG: RluA family pseudouridine synthase [Pseudomonadota bacterium]